MSLVNSFTLDLDLKSNNYISDLMITSSDTVTFVVNVFDDGVPLDLTNLTLTTIGHTRPDGTVVLKEGTKTGSNQVTFELGTTETSIPGRVNAKVQMYDGEDRVSTFSFNYTVSKDPSGEDYVPSEDDKTLIQQVLGDGPRILADAEQATIDANDAAENANSTADSIQSAENARVSAENTRIAQENTRESNESDRVSSEGIRVSSEQDRVSAEQLRATAESTRVSQENARKSNENIRESAENDRISAETLRSDAEDLRASQENVRQSNESDRIDAEDLRADSEDLRASQENVRQSNESDRIDSEDGRVIAETTRITQEDTRQSNEASRKTAEDGRVSAESVRVTSEAGRASAETIRSVQETARQQNYTTFLNNMMIIHKGTIDTYADLPTSGIEVGYTYVVTSDPDPTKNGTWRRQADNTWLRIHTYTPDGKASISDVEVVNSARSSIVRDSIHSGVVTMPALTYSTTVPNRITLSSDMVCYVNGYKISIPAGTNIDGTPPPTFGIREDLAFLEVWFPVGEKFTPSYRIRWVDGVDFNRYPNGLERNVGGVRNFTVQAQGGNVAPLAYTDNPTFDLYTGFFDTADRISTTKTGAKIALDDQGLYLAGRGDETSKTTLLTEDGYVYAIPLFRVKRQRNSGGYRVDNLSGGREFTIYRPNSITVPSGQSIQVTFTSTSGMVVGDVLCRGVGTSFLFRVLSVDSATTATIQSLMSVDVLLTSGDANSLYPSTLINDRPDGLFANLIDQTDIIPLWHKVSLTGLDYESLLDENREKLNNGTLQTKDTKTTVKESYGLMKAPFYVQPDLQAIKVKGNDGVERELKNLASLVSNWENNGISGGSGVINSANNRIRSKDFAKVSPSSYILTLSEKDYQLYVFEYSNGVYVKEASFSNYRKIQISAATNQIKLVAKKIDDSNITVSEFSKILPRLYEISQSDYDKIDVLPEFTGGDNIAAKFPYVDSLPTVVENLLPLIPDVVHANAKVTRDYGLTLTASGANERSYYIVKIPPSTNCVLTATHSGRLAVRSGGSAGAFIAQDDNGSTVADSVLAFTTPSDVSEIYVSLENTSGGTFTFSNWQLTKGTTAPIIFVPYGKHYIPSDYQGFNAHLGQNNITHSAHDGKTFAANRSIFSDALTSETRHDKIEVLKTPQPHITVTQSTEGEWKVGDKIAVKSDYGVITGQDVLFFKIMEHVGSREKKVNTTTGLTVGDAVRLYKPDYSVISAEVTVSEIDGDKITLSAGLNSSWGDDIVRPSLPTITAAGIAGTWTNLGTKEATYTITAAPTDNKTDILLGYSINYPAGRGLNNLPSDVLDGYVNEQRLVSGETVSVKANFEGKVNSNTDRVPHVMKRIEAETVGNLSLHPPTASELRETTSDGYNSLSILDGNVSSRKATSSGGIAQQLFSFNLIRLTEDKFGEGVFWDCPDTAAKVAKLRGTAPYAQPLVNRLSFNWWGYGSSPSGNKATAWIWNNTLASWTGGSSPNFHSQGTVTKITTGTSIVNERIDNNGFVHLLAYADPSDGVVASQINTDYVELLCELNVAETGYDILSPENQMPVLSENLLTQNQAFPVDTSGFSTLNAATISIETSGTLKVDLSDAVNAHTYSGIYINKTWGNIPNKRMYLSFEFKGESGVGYRLVEYTGGLSSSFSATGEWQRIDLAFDPGSDGSRYPRIDTSSDSSGSFYLRKIKLCEKVNAKWTPGRKKEVVLNYLGKLAGSSVENPHRALYLNSPSLMTPISGTGVEVSSSSYELIGKQDGGVTNVTSSQDGRYPQHMYEFDLSHLGMSLRELKNLIRNINISWTGHGSHPLQGYIEDPTSADYSYSVDKTSGSLDTFYNILNIAYYNDTGETRVDLGRSVSGLSGNTNKITVTLDRLPEGATGANIYLTNSGSLIARKVGSITTEGGTLEITNFTGTTGKPNVNTTGQSNGATFKRWRASTGSWYAGNSNTSDVPTTITSGVSTTVTDFITDDQKIYVLVHTTYPSDGETPAVLRSDYIKATITFSEQIDMVKSNIILVQPETKTIKTKFPTVSYRTGQNDVISLNYRHIPSQAISGVGTPDKELFAPKTFDITTLGTGGRNATDKPNLLTQLIPNPYDYTGGSLLPYMDKGIKQAMFDVDMRSVKPSADHPYVIVAAKLIVKNGSLYMRVFWQESKSLTHVNPTSYSDFLLEGRPLVKL